MSLVSNGRATKNGASAASASEPRDGDLVVLRASDGTSPFGVLQHPTGVQFVASTRDAAERMARSFAQAHHLDLWYRERGEHTLIERYRRLR